VITLSHPTANQNVRQAALALAAEGLLDEFWTCLNWNQNGILDRLLTIAPGIRAELRRRSFPREVQPFVRTYPLREASRLLASLLGLSSLVRGEPAIFGIDAVYDTLDRRVAERIANRLTSKAVYAYDGGAIATFYAARGRGIKCIYEHPIVHWRLVRQYQEEEAELSPEWAPTLGALDDSAEKLRRKDEELALADVIVTPSTFARESLALAAGISAPIHTIPYGTTRNVPLASRPASKGKLRVIYVGALTQAKGLGYLLEAASRLRSAISLTLVGRRVAETAPTASALEEHRWSPSLAHSDLLDLMREHDVLVLPSLHEGFGLVLTEAMSQGLVVIATRHTAAPDLLTDNVEGFLIPIRSAEAIEEKLVQLERDRERLGEMQKAAQEKARGQSWEIYRQRLARLAREVVGKPTS
jgi:starch synthase